MALKRKGGYHMVAVKPGIYRQIAAWMRFHRRSAVYMEANILLEEALKAREAIKKEEEKINGKQQ